jgi:two-component system chemotaxis response regulator CheB
VRSELIEKLRAARFMRREEPEPPPASRPKVRAPRPASPERARLVLVGASTGGPPAVQRLLEGLAGLPVCVVVAQHMPARFTQAFAERLDQALPFRVTEARTGDVIAPGRVYVAPGGEQLELALRSGDLVLEVKMASPDDAHAPSVDRLFASAARLDLPDVRAVVLTGMGADGAKGALALKRAGAEVWAEAESTAVVFGMPAAAIKVGAVTKTLPLDELGPELARALKLTA